MRRAVALLGVLGAVAAGVSLSVLPVGHTSAAAKDERTFLIPASDGYGVAECIAGKSECGKIVANAWCESQGFGRATAFGLAAREDFTGTVATATENTSAAPTEQPLSITCGE